MKIKNYKFIIKSLVFCLSIGVLIFFTASAKSSKNPVLDLSTLLGMPGTMKMERFKTLSPTVNAFDSDKPVASFSTTYTQEFKAPWDEIKFYNQWEVVQSVQTGGFTATDIQAGYLQFAWLPKRIIYSKTSYTTPYILETDLDYSSGSNRGGVVIRANVTTSTNAEYLQAPPTGTGFNREGIAFYPSIDGLNMVVQFSGAESGTTTTLKQISVPKPAGVTNMKNRGSLRIEDFGTSIYVYYNGASFIRINLGGKSGNIYTSGTVYNAAMQVAGTFTGMEIENAGKVSVAQRDATLRLYSASIQTAISVPAFDSDKPVAVFSNTYYQEYKTPWDSTKFYNQWEALVSGAFSAVDVTSGYLQFVWTSKRIIYSKASYVTPYVLETDLDYSTGSNRGGVVIRANVTTDRNADYLQEPLQDPGFNREGIAFYPTVDGLSMNVQFSGAESGSATTIKQITVPKPFGVASLLGRGKLKIEDYGTSIYVYYNGNPYIRIALADKVGSAYSSGIVYDAVMNVKGTFSGMEVETAGKVAIAQRDATLQLYSVNINYGINTSWTGATSSDWTDASNWSAGLPNELKEVTIGTGTFQPIIASTVTINKLTIATGATLTVASGNLIVTGAIVNSGTMTMTSNANLIQGGTTNTNTGKIIVNRNSNALSRLDYTIWSSPVSAQDLLLFSPSTLTSPSRFYTYNETTNLYNAITNPSGTSFAKATGYLIRMPDNAVMAPATQTFAGIFTGVPNNGSITKAVTSLDSTHGYNMIGNPYPSTIDAQTFIDANTAAIESSLYFWRKTNGATGSAYAVYNSLGAISPTPSSDLPNGKIQVGQGFFVKAKSGATTVNFTNAMRVANNDNQFFKTKQVVQRDRLWLNLSNSAGAFSQALIGYTNDAVAGVDKFDAKFFNDSEIALTSIINNEEYSIQGRPAFEQSDVVALHFKTDVAGDYNIALGQFDGIFSAGQDIYLQDNATGTETDLKSGSYTFAAVAGVDNSRFSLKYQKTLKVDAPAFNENSVRVYKNNGLLYVNSGNVALSTVTVFDIQGRLIAEQKNVKSTLVVFHNLKSVHQVLIVKIKSEDHNEVIKKIVN